MFSRNVSAVGRVFCGLAKVSKPSVLQTKSYSCCINQSMEKHKIIPDVIQCPPKYAACVVFPSGAEVRQGNELTPRQVKGMPEVNWKAEKKSFYIVLMTDPDAPSLKDPTAREWQHWLVGNIPCDEVFRGETLTPYIGAGPLNGTGLHRYVILVFKQPKRLKFNEERLSASSAKGRERFSTRKFIAKYELGDPVAGNFFHAQYDDYVPQLYKKLGIKI